MPSRDDLDYGAYTIWIAQSLPEKYPVTLVPQSLARA